jgi:hypothetical protein
MHSDSLEKQMQHRKKQGLLHLRLRKKHKLFLLSQIKTGMPILLLVLLLLFSICCLE